MEKSCGVVHPDVQVGQMRGGLSELAPVGWRKHAGAHPANVHASLGAQHAIHDLLPRHFEREHDNAESRLLPSFVWVACALELLRTRHIDRDIEDEARLAHARTRCHDREFAVVQPARESVVTVETSGDTDNASAARRRLRDALEGFLHRHTKCDQIVRFARASDVVHSLLSRVDELLRLAITGVPLRRHALTRQDELPHARLLVDRPAVRDDVRNSWRSVEDVGEVRHSTDLSNAIAISQPRADLDNVHRLAFAAELDARLVDSSVGLRVEMLRGEELDHLVERQRVDHHCRQDRRLCFEIMRRDTAVSDPAVALRLPRGRLQLLQRASLLLSPHLGQL